MENLNFYDNIRDMIYDFDRTGAMDPRLEDYFERTIAKNGDLALAFIKTYFIEFIEKNPEVVNSLLEANLKAIIKHDPDKWIPELDEVIADIANDRMNIRVGFVRNVARNDKVYSTLDEAKADLPRDLDEVVTRLSQEYTLDEDKFFDQIWQEIGPDGEEVRRLTESEVRDYVANFRGDKEALKKLLHLPDDKKPEKPAAKKPAAKKPSPKKSSKTQSKEKTGSEKKAE